MPQLIVIANKLNVRAAPVTSFAERDNITGIVTKGFTFESTSQVNNNLGFWYSDKFSNFYWAGGLAIDINSIQADNKPAAVITTPSDKLLKPPSSVPQDLCLSHLQCLRCATWMKNNFEEKVIIAVGNTPFDKELIYAIACQETAQRWQLWIDVFDAATILERCVFDASGDFPDTSRSAFPKNKAEFQAQMGNTFCQMLIDEGNNMRAMPQPGFPHGYGDAGYLYKGYGIFQYDLQNVKTDNTFFENKLWYLIDECLNRVISELIEKWKLHTNDMYNTVKAYNGSGTRAENYAQKVSQFYTWIKQG